jgi:hypothetical protein
LWAAAKLQDVNDVTLAAQSLLKYPDESFVEIAEGASWWLKESAHTLEEDLLWPLWDRIAGVVIEKTEEAPDHDAFSAALNHPSGHLAEVLLKKLPKGADGQQLPEIVRVRLNVLVTAAANVGHLARIRLARDVSLLFERAPDWTKQTIIPLFDWSSPEAAAAWSARKYANFIGSPELFGLTKEPFLALFGRPEVSNEEVRIFASWLAAIAFANQEQRANYPITPAEVRSALRRAPRSLSSVGHRIAVEMERAKSEEKLVKWRKVINPVFQSIWPLDAELQTSASTFKLVQILRASGAAFREAAEVIVPFIRSDDAGHTSIYSISTADDILYATAPDKLLDLVAAVVGDPPSRGIFGLRKALDRIREHAPQLANEKKFQKLLGLAAN